MEINLPYRQVFLSLQNPPKICFACTKSCLLALSLFLFFFFKDLTNFVTFLLYFFPPKQLCVIFSPVDKKMLPVFTFISWGPPHVLILFLLLFLRSGCFIWFDGDLCVLEFWCDLNFQWDGCQSQIRTM